ncbi:MAG: putative nucleosome assembly protein [Streblomastix strix]|uniref:Putative nucleosome assembly protein n=1 Tax=Streblomastix strix TaxID=222440 RepID=A0A5J4VE78_9EUKA|nr:MAG: putative nucleosome assembly protein [Streblomastix strix]
MAQNLASLLEQKLKNLLNKPSGLLDCYSAPVKRRIRAVKKIQDEHDALQEAMEAELRALEKKYDEIYHPLFESRQKLILGELEPDDSDLVPLDDDSEKNPQDYDKVEQTLRPDGTDRGIPRYWSDALSNHKFIEMFITEDDLDALNYLDDIEIKRSDIGDIEKKVEDNEEKKQDESETKKNGEVKALILHFGENPYFTNRVLTKVMTVVKVGVAESVQSQGVKINWKEGKNLGEINLVEVQVRKEKKKTKKSKKVKQDPKEVHIPHTFTKRTFFDLLISDEELGSRHKRMISEEKERKRTLLSIHKQKVREKKKEKEELDGDDVEDDEEVDDEDMFDVDDEDEKIVYSDHKDIETLKEVLSDASQIIIDEIFPQSYPWFTGEKALDDDDDDEEEEEELAGLDDEDDDDADDDDEDDDDEDEDDKKAKRKKGKKPKGKPSKKEKTEKKEGGGQKEVPPECKQQ